MENILTWTINQYVLLGIVLAIFAFLGLKRGVNRELLSMIGVGLGILLADGLAHALQGWINRFYKLGRFALAGGLTADDPTQAWQQIEKLPALVSTPEDLRFLGILIFLILTLVVYLLGQRFIAAPKTAMAQFLGLLAGGINGFLVAYYLFPLVLAPSKAVINLPSSEVKATLGSSRTIAMVVVLVIVVLIAFGLHSTPSGRRR